MIVLITGATSGFGKAIAYKFAAHGSDLILCGRRKERLDELERSIKDTCSVRVFTCSFDVRDSDAVHRELQGLPHDWKKIDVLVNNAGLAAGLQPIHEGHTDDWETMIDTNLKGLLYVSREVIPGMTERRRGHIINIGSTAAKDAYPRGNVYCATKAAVDMLSKNMRIDLLPFNIRVTCIHPGAAETEFSLVRFKGDQEAAGAVYRGFEPLKADDVADVVWFAASRPAHVCLNDIVMTPAAQANSLFIQKTQSV